MVALTNKAGYYRKRVGDEYAAHTMAGRHENVPVFRNRVVEAAKNDWKRLQSNKSENPNALTKKKIQLG